MKRHSLLFGIASYAPRNGFSPLKCPLHDAEALADLLGNPAYAGDTGLLIVGRDRTRAQAEQDLRDLLSSPDLTPKEDLIHIHFSGHGMRDDDGKFYLCFVDTVASELAFSALSYETLKHWLEVKRIQRALITLDCCYSGAAIHKDALASGAEVLAKAIASDPGSDGAQGKGYCVVTATGDRELALEGKEGVHGRQGAPMSVFTHYLVRGIVSGEADTGNKGYVTAADLHGYVSRKVKNDAASMHPHIGGKTEGEIFVARNPKALDQQKRVQDDRARAAFEARHRDFAQQVHAWLVQQYAANVFDAAFVAEVEDWVKAASAGMEQNRRYLLLQQAIARSIKAVSFFQQWREDQDRPALAAGRQAAFSPEVSLSQAGRARAAQPARAAAAHDGPGTPPRPASTAHEIPGRPEPVPMLWMAALEVIRMSVAGVGLSFILIFFLFDIFREPFGGLLPYLLLYTAAVVCVLLTRRSLGRRHPSPARQPLALSQINVLLRIALLSVPAPIYVALGIAAGFPESDLILITSAVVVQLVTVLVVERRW